MDAYIQISKINDFLFCPRSLYFHAVFEDFSTDTYHDIPQMAGNVAHASIDEKRYSTDAHMMQGTEVISDAYGLVGKIDVFDSETGVLTERKRTVVRIYDGYRYQLYAQYLCLKEAGQCVKRMRIHSLTNNVMYEIPFFTETEHDAFCALLEKMRTADSETVLQGAVHENKCARCIYKSLCR